MLDNLVENVIRYAEPGPVILRAIQRGPNVEVEIEDRGPGIADLSLALKDGYTTGNGLGLGLSGAKRLSHDFAIDSKIGEGTRVVIARSRRLR